MINWSDLTLKHNRNHKTKLTLEQQSSIYDAYYDGVRWPYAGGLPSDERAKVTITIKQLASQYGVAPRTISMAIEREQIRRINPEAGEQKP